MPMPTREAQREYQRNWKAKRRAEWFKDKQCAKCGSTADLELDHIEPTRKVSHNIWSWSEERMLTELAKCQVLCVNCHKRKTRLDIRQMDVKALLRIADPPGMAWCYAGGHFASTENFTKDRSKRRGLQNECKSCRSKRRSASTRKPPRSDFGSYRQWQGKPA